MPKERRIEREGGVQRSTWEPQKPASSRCASLFVRCKEEGGRHAARKNGPRRREREKDVSKNRLTRSFSHSRSYNVHGARFLLPLSLPFLRVSAFVLYEVYIEEGSTGGSRLSGA